MSLNKECSWVSPETFSVRAMITNPTPLHFVFCALEVLFQILGWVYCPCISPAPANTHKTVCMAVHFAVSHGCSSVSTNGMLKKLNAHPLPPPRDRVPNVDMVCTKVDPNAWMHVMQSAFEADYSSQNVLNPVSSCMYLPMNQYSM